MSEQHTPGPWTLTHIDGSNFAVQRFEIRGMFGDNPNIYPIFNRDLSAIDGGSIYTSPENARLIASAPELLEAAELVLAGLNERIDSAPVGSAPVFAGIAALHDAIAKARGS